MKLAFVWLCEAWPTYRKYLKQRRWHKAREHKSGFIIPLCSGLSLSEMLVASGALRVYGYPALMCLAFRTKRGIIQSYTR